MSHGSQGYFEERRRFDRRLSITIAVVSLVVLSAHLVLILPPLRRALLEPLLRGPLTARRFGFEGPDQFVERVVLETSGPPGPNPGRPTILYRSLRAVKGGRPDTRPSDDPHARPDTRRVGSGAGESSEDLMTMARTIYGGSAPVMQSEDLIIDVLVKPEYPQDARDRDIEGRVALVALVDTLGQVARVNLMSSTGEHQLEQASIDAVRQCRFRPYTVDGRRSEVYAVFRFVFRIY